jgi:A/G-specific adenine glycosylase
MLAPPDDQTHAVFAERLLAWFTHHTRDLPWRRERTPYRVWVAEVMLQQTRAETVVSYYDRFVNRFPSIQALADAPLEDVLRVWEGLGYYARARHLHAAAQEVTSVHNGQLPDTFEELLDLPGIGRYTAGAIASIIFGKDVAAVDGNARRVLCRTFGVHEDVTRPRIQRKLESLATKLLPSGQAGTFNEALMELGATICTSRAPRCEDCPWRTLCQAYTQGDPESLPKRRPRQQVPHYDVAAAVTLRDGRVLVAQRNVDDMLGGLWEFPGGTCKEGETLPECLTREMQEELGVNVKVEKPLITIEHGYTHFRITLHSFRCHLVSGDLRCLDCAAFRWVTPTQLDTLPMSVADRKVAQALQQALRRGSGRGLNGAQ